MQSELEELTSDLELEDIRVVERPDGFYWEDPATGKAGGPFMTRALASADAQYDAEQSISPEETLEEAEAEIGIAEWIDQDTGEPAEEFVPRLEEH